MAFARIVASLIARRPDSKDLHACTLLKLPKSKHLTNKDTLMSHLYYI